MSRLGEIYGVTILPFMEARLGVVTSRSVSRHDAEGHIVAKTYRGAGRSIPTRIGGNTILQLLVDVKDEVWPEEQESTSCECLCRLRKGSFVALTVW